MQLIRRELTCGLLVVTVCGTLVLSGPAALAAPPEEDMKAVADGNTAFALDLYGRLRTQSGNLFLSPYNISAALAMTFAGARAETAEQMAKVVHFTLGPDRLHPGFGALEASIRSAGEKPECRLLTANALWGQQGEGFLPAFLELTRKDYGAGLREVDFAKATEAARQTINAWVQKQTQDKIKDLLSKDDVSDMTRLVLTSAIYFKADWVVQFEEKWTKDAPFRLGKDKQVTVPTMHKVNYFPLAAADDLDLLEMPYVGERLSMVILLPKKVDGLAALEQSVTPAKLATWLAGLRPQNASVELPRFNINARFELGRTLADMGMTDAFVFEKADFSGMNGHHHDLQSLYIAKVIHQAHVGVNEAGTEAGAATAVSMAVGSIPKTPTPFVADHPFLFLIRDRQTGSILFLGRLVNPKE